MFIKKGSRVYNSEYGFGTALTDEENHIGAVVKFDRENKNLLSAKEISFIITGDLDYMFERFYLKSFLYLNDYNPQYTKKLLGICYSKDNEITYKMYGIDNIEVKLVNQNSNKDSNKNTFKNSQFDASKDFVDKVIKDKKKTENMTIKDFAKEKENNMDNLYGYDATLKKQENKDKPCKNDSCACKNKNKDNKSCDNNVKYIFVSKENKELIYGNNEEVADFLWNRKDADEVINETDDIEDFDVYKITGNLEKVPLKKTVKFSI